MINKLISKSLKLNEILIPKAWKRAECEFAGQCIKVISSNGSSEILEILLKKKGSYEIHLGNYLTPKRKSSMQVRLSSEKYWRRVLPLSRMGEQGGDLQDCLLGSFKLNGDEKLLVRTEHQNNAAIGYVTLLKTKLKRERYFKDNIGVILDMAEIMGIPRIDTPDDLCAVLAPYEKSDFSHIFWGNAAGSYNPLYFSKALGFLGEHESQLVDKQRPHRENAAKVMQMFKKLGRDPLEMMIEFAHKHKLKLWSNDRISKNHESDFTNKTTGGRFLLKHKNKRVLTADGQVFYQLTMSFAYPEIRENKIEFLLEQAEMGVDGIFIDFLRKRVLVGLEKKVVDDFKKKYGENIHKLIKATPKKEWIDRLLQLQADYVTGFMVDLKKRLKAVEKRKGRKIPIGVQVPGGWGVSSCRPSACSECIDIGKWIKKGLIDFVAPVDGDCLMYSLQVMDRFKQLTEGSNCQLWGSIAQLTPELRPTHAEKKTLAGNTCLVDAERVARTAYDYVNQGADGVFIWEAEEVACIPQRWEVLKRLGHKKEMQNKFGMALKAFDGSDVLC